MIWGIIRRNVASSQVLGQASKVKLGFSGASYSRTAGKEVLFISKGFRCFQSSTYHTLLGGHVYLKPREVCVQFQTESFTKLRSRSFSSDNGDVVEAAVPFMSESITDGTLATFL